MKSNAKPGPRRRFDARGKMLISRLSLHEQVVNLVRQMIVSGALEAGEKIRINELAQELDVSLTPLREALKVLAGEKLVVLMPNRGARVAPMTVEGIQELFEVIAGIESMAAELAACRISESDLAEIEEQHTKMALHHQRGETEKYFELNRKIHDLVVACSGNDTLIEIRSQLSNQAERARFMATASGLHRKVAMQDHEDLMDALRTRNASDAAIIWRRHLTSSGAETCRILELLNAEHSDNDQGAAVSAQRPTT